MARCFDAAERDARVGCDHLVDENHTRLEFVDEALTLSVVFRPGAGTGGIADRGRALYRAGRFAGRRATDRGAIS